MTGPGKQIKSLITNIKNQLTFSFYYLINDQHNYVATLNDENLTLKQAVTQIVDKINKEYHLDLVSDWTQYQVFAAKKCGKKKTGMPSFDKSQLLKQTALKNFYLQLKLQKPKLQSKGSINSIKSQINWQMNRQKRPQVSQKFFQGCFCLTIKS